MYEMLDGQGALRSADERQHPDGARERRAAARSAQMNPNIEVSAGDRGDHRPLHGEGSRTSVRLDGRGARARSSASAGLGSADVQRRRPRARSLASGPFSRAIRRRVARSGGRLGRSGPSVIRAREASVEPSVASPLAAPRRDSVTPVESPAGGESSGRGGQSLIRLRRRSARHRPLIDGRPRAAGGLHVARARAPRPRASARVASPPGRRLRGAAPMPAATVAAPVRQNSFVIDSDPRREREGERRRALRALRRATTPSSGRHHRSITRSSSAAPGFTAGDPVVKATDSADRRHATRRPRPTFRSRPGARRRRRPPTPPASPPQGFKDIPY